ncbi:MAG: SDR family oxidoreductase [Martelella sp.]|uniref:SDR family NAD(P)-dependent oxidoreductase n=1 Tax=Martelella sp. TaxID=1969699 RepID=UPI0032420861
MEFENKVILISGAGRARGQGAAEARHLAERGARVLIGDICDEEGSALAADIGAHCEYLHLDVTDEDDWTAAMGRTAELGGLSGLVNNAAVYIPNFIADATAKEMELHTRVNQLGAFLGMKYAAEAMSETGGSIVNVSSSAGLKGSPRSIAYCATKWALRGMTKAAALDFGPKKIRVNSIHPGPIDTPMLDGYNAEQRAARQALVPLGREGEVSEVAELAAFLLSDRSRFITGAEIAIDGGVTL